MILDDIALAISNLDVSGVYSGVGQIAKITGASITPILLLMAIYIRSLEASLDMFGSNSSGRWTRAVRDIVLWTAVLASYFAICQLVINFANELYKWGAEIGSLDAITKDMNAAIQSRVIKRNKEGFISTIITLAATGGGVFSSITAFFFYLSLLVVAFLSAFLKIAHALTFGVAFIWGLIAIPISISQGFKLLRGWALLFGLALLWPFIQALLIAMLRPVFATALNAIVTQDTNSGVDMMSTELLFTVLNLVFGATLVAAPFLANALISNTSAAHAIVAPFVAAALAGATGAANAAGGAGQRGLSSTKEGVSNIYKTARSAIQGSSTAPTPQQARSISNAKTTFKTNQLTPDTPPTTASGGVNTAGQQTAALQPGAPTPANANLDQQRKTRRGVILNQNKNKAAP